MDFIDRVDAGHRLALQLQHLRGEPLAVLGLPRGGVPVAFEVARTLDAPLDVIVVRKLGVPFQPELAMGAVGEGDVLILNDDVLRHTGVGRDEVVEVEARERVELERRARRFRGDRPRLDLRDRVAVIVDDGIATGSTARAACQVARAQGAGRVVVAVPVAPVGWEARMGSDADECIALDTPEPFWAIGQFYADFSQTPDEEVVACLTRAAERAPVPPTPTPPVAGGSGGHAAAGAGLGAAAGAPPGDRPGIDEDVTLAAGPVELGGRLTVPAGAVGVVAFAHGSGSSRHSPRNRYVAEVLNRAGLGTLLFDLLTTTEERDRANVFDIALLARRLVDATRWLVTQPAARGLPVGYFGASTGAAAALWAAGEAGTAVGAVVSRGGRPDLAAPRLGAVSAPTLLVVGGRDEVVLDLNRVAQGQLGGESRLAVVEGATHLFEEPGTLQAAAELARDWFLRCLGTPAPAPPPPRG